MGFVLCVDRKAVENGADHSFVHIAEPILVHQHGLFSNSNRHVVLEKAVVGAIIQRLENFLRLRVLIYVSNLHHVLPIGALPERCLYHERLSVLL